MKKIQIYNSDGKLIQADLIFAFTNPENGKEYVAINNGDMVFSGNSSYNNLDILEIIANNQNLYRVSNIPDEDWEDVKDIMLKEIFAKIKSDY